MTTAWETRTEQATYHNAETRPGKCAICGQAIEQRRLWDACAYVTKDSQTVVSVHKTCAGVEDKGKIGGGRKVVRAPEITVMVRVPILHDA